MAKSESNPWLDFLLRYRRWITVSVVVVVFVTMVVLRIAANHHQVRRSDFLQAATYFSQLKTDGGNHEEILAQLQAIMARHEELHARYDGELAQSLLSHNKSHVAEGYSYSIAERLGTRYDFAALFTKATFLISDGLYLDALRESIALKLALENEQREDLQTLYAYNLLRIAMLQQEAGTEEAELEAWQELRHNLPEQIDGDGKRDGYYHLVQNFRKGNVSLIDYINERIASLELIVPSNRMISRA